MPPTRVWPGPPPRPKEFYCCFDASLTNGVKHLTDYENPLNLDRDSETKLVINTRNNLGYRYTDILEKNAKLLNKFYKIVIEAYGLGHFSDKFKVDEFTLDDVKELEQIFKHLEHPFIFDENLVFKHPANEGLRDSIIVSRKLLNLIPPFSRSTKSARAVE